MSIVLFLWHGYTFAYSFDAMVVFHCHSLGSALAVELGRLFGLAFAFNVHGYSCCQ